MKKLLSVGLCVLFALGVRFTEAGECYPDPCETAACDPCGPNLFDGCGSKKSLWEFGGWLEAGIYGNEYGQKNAYSNGYLIRKSGNTDTLQNVRQSDFQLNQLWIYGQKKLSKRGFDIGGRVDFAYGTDMSSVQSENLEFNYVNARDRWNSGDYYTALPQLYVEVGYNNLSVKAGKFLSPLGHDSIMSPNRFFYSLPFAYRMTQNTLSGVVATWEMSEKFTIYGGWVSGEDRTFDSGDDNAFLGGIQWRPGKRLTISYGLVTGKDKEWQMMPPVPNGLEYFVHSLVFDLKLNKRWNYVCEWTLRDDHDTLVDANKPKTQNFGGYGVKMELIHKYNDRWSFGLRGEWMKAHGNGMEGHLPGANDRDRVHSVTLGANWKPTKRITLRPEIRYDSLKNTYRFNRTKSGDKDNKREQCSFGVSGVVKF